MSWVWDIEGVTRLRIGDILHVHGRVVAKEITEDGVQVKFASGRWRMYDIYDAVEVLRWNTE